MFWRKTQKAIETNASRATRFWSFHLRGEDDEVERRTSNCKAREATRPSWQLVIAAASSHFSLLTSHLIKKRIIFDLRVRIEEFDVAQIDCQVARPQ